MVYNVMKCHLQCYLFLKKYFKQLRVLTTLLSMCIYVMGLTYMCFVLC